MPPTVHTIHPVADAVILLKNPCRNFAPWKEAAAPSSHETAKVEDKHTKPGHCAEDNSIDESGREPGIVPEACHSDTEEIHYLVSSHHLMSASPWFMRALTAPGFRESVKDPADNRHHIDAECWDEEALLILLNVFHSRVRKIPATVSLEMLAKIAVLVNYYDLDGAEVMERDLKSWIDAVRRNHPVPNSYCRDLMLWIWVAQVFSMDEEFERATIVAIKGSQDHIQTLGLPIRGPAIANINSHRCDAIECFIAELHRLLEVYRDFNYVCPQDQDSSFQCGAFLFGALSKHMEAWGYRSLRPNSPFEGISLKDIGDKGREIGKLVWGQEAGKKKGYRLYEAHPCRLDVEIDKIVQKAMTTLSGLETQESKELGTSDSRLRSDTTAAPTAVDTTVDT